MGRLKRLIRKVIRNSAGQEEQKPLILNEAVNFEKKVIFIAVPKTGTTSVRVQIRPYGRPIINNQHLNIIQIRDSLYVYFLTMALGNNTSFPSELIPTDADLRARASEVFQTYFKFSGVRNPWARAVSLYYRREGVQVSDRLSFEEFCMEHLYASDTCKHPTLHKNQYDWLCDENGKMLMDYVYQIEELNNAIDEIAERTDGRLVLTYKRENVNPSSLAFAYRDLYTEETKKIIAKRFEKDIEYFNYTF